MPSSILPILLLLALAASSLPAADPLLPEDSQDIFNTCGDGIDNGDGDGADADDPDCRIGDDLGGGEPIPADELPNGATIRSIIRITCSSLSNVIGIRWILPFFSM